MVEKETYPLRQIVPCLGEFPSISCKTRLLGSKQGVNHVLVTFQISCFCCAKINCSCSFKYLYYF